MIRLACRSPTTFDKLYQALKEIKKANPSVRRLDGPQARLAERHQARADDHRLPLWQWPGRLEPKGINVPYWEETEGKGKWLYGPIHPEFKDVLAYFAKLYKEKLLDPDFAIATPDQWHEKNSSGKGCSAWDNFSFCVRWNQAIRGTDPKATWTPSPSTRAPRVRARTTTAASQAAAAAGASAPTARILTAPSNCWTGSSPRSGLTRAVGASRTRTTP